MLSVNYYNSQKVHTPEGNDRGSNFSTTASRMSMDVMLVIELH